MPYYYPSDLLYLQMELLLAMEQNWENALVVKVTTGVFQLELAMCVVSFLELQRDVSCFLQLLFVMQTLQHQEFKIQRQIKLQYAWGVKNQV